VMAKSWTCVHLMQGTPARSSDLFNSGQEFGGLQPLSF
jgi:hypothetical protein